MTPLKMRRASSGKPAPKSHLEVFSTAESDTSPVDFQIKKRGGQSHVEMKIPSRDRLAVSDPKIREQLQLAGLRFLRSRAQWLASEAHRLGHSLLNGKISSAEVDAV